MSTTLHPTCGKWEKCQTEFFLNILFRLNDTIGAPGVANIFANSKQEKLRYWNYRNPEFENLLTLGLYSRQPQKERENSIFQRFFFTIQHFIFFADFHLCIALITGLLCRVILLRARRTARGGRCTGARLRSRSLSLLLPTPSSKLLLIVNNSIVDPEIRTVYKSQLRIQNQALL